MSKILQKDTLPAPIRNELVRIMSKEPNQVTKTEKDFLIARRDYLSSDEKKAFGVKAPTKAKK